MCPVGATLSKQWGGPFGPGVLLWEPWPCAGEWTHRQWHPRPPPPIRRLLPFPQQGWPHLQSEEPQEREGDLLQQAVVLVRAAS